MEDATWDCSVVIMGDKDWKAIMLFLGTCWEYAQVDRRRQERICFHLINSAVSKGQSWPWGYANYSRVHSVLMNHDSSFFLLSIWIVVISDLDLVPWLILHLHKICRDRHFQARMTWGLYLHFFSLTHAWFLSPTGWEPSQRHMSCGSSISFS